MSKWFLWLWTICKLECHTVNITVPLLNSYDNDGTTRDEIKERFSLTMDFVENYLREVVSQNIPFSDKEKNKLTFEVIPLGQCPFQMSRLTGSI